MDSLNSISGIGAKTQEKLNRLKIKNKKDLVYHLPSRYVDFSHSTKISDAIENENVTITGKVTYFQNIFTRSHKNLQKAIVKDDSGSINLIWFNQPYLANSIKIGDTLSFAGTVTFYQNKKTIIAPEYGQYNTGKIIAVYPETSGLSSKWFRKTIQTNLTSLIQDIPDPLSSSILKKFQLFDLKTALIQIHTPTNLKTLNLARTRLALDEILSLQVQSFLNRKTWLSKKPQVILKTNSKIEKQIQVLIDSLPFKLTDSQIKVWNEIKKDLTKTNQVTNRLLQGDVGSGKTIIAILGCFLAHLNNTISLVIAPTEILTQQHFLTFKQILKNFKVPIYLLTGNSKVDFKKIPKNSIIVGTHAAIYQKNKFEHAVSFLVVDEQHKFGVKQRSFLSSSINQPHNLTMTATPIPRTISLTLLGNLDMSVIDTLPQNRLSIKTFYVPNNKKNNCYHWIRQEILKTKCQAFIVCPFIDLSETLTSVKAATEEFENLSKNAFPDLKLELIHGKTKIKDREKIISRFKDNKINILVTTPIIEVGIDIPNTSIIIIQSADRFGLAQLHQLRGRVGRGHSQSYCYLFTESNNEKAIKRLEFLQKHTNGLKIAEYDLETRGPGEAFSVIQHGFPSLKIATLSDAKLISLSQQILDYLLKLKNFKIESLIVHKELSENITTAN